MQFLRTIFWVILAVMAVIFAVGNWHAVTINLWGDVQVDSKLPVLLFGAFLLGLVPTLILYRATRWRLKRRLEIAERALADARAQQVETPAVPIAEAVSEAPTPAYVPTAVPPGV
ncbi:lipopolysaccharide assembly protein LapA domain-containing protein [Sphingomonas sp. C3-2]|uniref:lipopolysaccharide assembly protein LapA domain-containing protein n=1 Tax=Sphingomonas sp. C3-2 TaxID=3062169 RepID=UPI00294B5B6F|nr:lipopolysaccharide assembly protein LapA domain-containing protein [Sphingomonas sp. C3-2]WOK37115.1 lipopolysaccharide assembly protein LapA domain-containing protein [Sphingomonas sp. C3-2]